MTGKKYGVKREAPAITGKVPGQYPWLCEDMHCDVCVTGGGMTGALCAMLAAGLGLSAVLITSEGLGFGDTGHMPGCAEFSGGRTLTGLDRVMNAGDALRLYAAGFEALDDLQNLCALLDGEFAGTGISTGFQRRDSLLFTADPTMGELLECEYLALRKTFPDCTLITPGTAGSAFAFDLHAGILVKDGSGVFDPYAFTHLCAMKARELGAEIFEQTRAEDIQTPKNDSGSVIVTASTHRRIYADRLIFAAGSEGLRSMFRRARQYTAFCSLRRLSEGESGWPGKCSLRTFGRRSMSFSISGGGRVTACAEGGKGDAAAFSRLDRMTGRLLPDAAGGPEYEYSCPFSVPRDGMPVIGRRSEFRNCFFALPSSLSPAGAPGFSVMAARGAEAFLEGNNRPVLPWHDPERM